MHKFKFNSDNIDKRVSNYNEAYYTKQLSDKSVTRNIQKKGGFNFTRKAKMVREYTNFQYIYIKKKKQNTIECFLTWLLRALSVVNGIWQIWQINASSPVTLWLFKCLSMLLFTENLWLQTGHMYGLSPVCVLLWSVNRDAILVE